MKFFNLELSGLSAADLHFVEDDKSGACIKLKYSNGTTTSECMKPDDTVIKRLNKNTGRIR